MFITCVLLKHYNSSLQSVTHYPEFTIHSTQQSFIQQLEIKKTFGIIFHHRDRLRFPLQFGHPPTQILWFDRSEQDINKFESRSPSLHYFIGV